MPKTVTTEQAEAVLEALKVQFASFIPDGAPADYLPRLEPSSEWFCDDSHEGLFVVIWDEGAPYFDWARDAFRAQVDWARVDVLIASGKSIDEAEQECTTQPPALPEGVWVECVNFAVLQILPRP